MENQVVEPEVNTEQLRQEILTEKKGEVPSGKKPWEVRLEQDHPQFKDEPKEEEPAKEVVEEEKPSSEEQPAETESQPVEEQPEAEAQPDQANKDTAKEDAYVAEYAKKSSITVEEAKEEINSLKAISAKYGDDPVKIAKAYREMQSGYDKLKVQASSNINPAVAEIAANPRNFIIGKVKANADKLIAEFREQNPARSRDMDDEQVTEEIVERGTFAIKEQIRGYEIQLKKDASSKRDSFVSGTSEADRRFLPEIKPVLDQLPDWQVISPTFRYEDLISWAKGKSVDRLIKEAVDRVHKEYESKGKTIKGEIAKPSQATKVKQTQEQSKSAGLSKWDKDQALAMFSSGAMSDEEKFEAYTEIKNRKNKK